MNIRIQSSIRFQHFLGLVCVLGMIIQLGCRPSSESGSSTSSNTTSSLAKYKLALVMKSLANEFFETMAKGAQTHHQQHADAYDLIVNGIKNESDLNQQINIVEQMIGNKVDAIVIAPADSKALIPICKRALDQGIAVVNIDNKFDDEVLQQVGVNIPFVGPDNRAGARTVGEELARHLKAGDKVAIIEGIPTAFNAQQRRLGFEDAMKAAGMNVIGIQSGYWEMDKAATVSAAFLSEHPDLKALLCSNDSMALGAVSAVKAAGKAGQVLIVGFDNISAIQEMLRDGRVLATADQHGDQLAVFGLEYALQILRDKSKPENRETPVDLITRDALTKTK